MPTAAHDAADDSDLPGAARPASPLAITGTLLARFIVPLWVLAGAAFKLYERNPMLLPPPVLDTSFWIADTLGIADRAAFIEHTLRFLIATELVLVAIMFFVPKLARLAAIFTLSIFVLVLARVIASGAASCGCFGSSGPSPTVVLVIDSILLLGVLLLPATALRAPRCTAAALLAVVASAIGVGFAYGIPDRTLPPQVVMNEAGEGADGGAAGPRDGEPASPQAAGRGAGETSTPAPPWPPVPALVTTYAPNFASWIDTPLRSHDLALLASRPLPALDSGGWVVVYYRGDCEHCHELISDHLSDVHAARTLLIRVPENDPALDQPLPDAPFQRAVLPDGPFYVFQTPVMLGVVDGTVKALATDPDDFESITSALELVAAATPAAASSVADAAPPPAQSAPTPTAPATSTPPGGARAAWPAAPPLVNTYAPDFSKLIGKRLSELDVALQISRPLPATIDEGSWIVVFYRGDCEHCHALIEEYLAEEHAERTILVRVPENDPSMDIPLAPAPFKMHVLPDGPFYVFQTPVMLGVRDGVVRSLATDPDDSAAVTAAIDAALQ